MKMSKSGLATIRKANQWTLTDGNTRTGSYVDLDTLDVYLYKFSVEGEFSWPLEETELDDLSVFLPLDLLLWEDTNGKS